MYQRANPLPVAATLYRQPRKDSDVKTVLDPGTEFEECKKVPDFPGWWSVVLEFVVTEVPYHSVEKRGYVYVPTVAWNNGEGV